MFLIEFQQFLHLIDNVIDFFILIRLQIEL